MRNGVIIHKYVTVVNLFFISFYAGSSFTKIWKTHSDVCNMKESYSKGTKDSHILHRAQQTGMIPLIIGLS